MFLTALIIPLLFGGGRSSADVRYRYDVLAEKVGSGIKTNFIIYSKSMEDAKDEVTLNGWKVISAKKLDSSETVLKKDEKILNSKDSAVEISDNSSDKSLGNKNQRVSLVKINKNIKPLKSKTKQNSVKKIAVTSKKVETCKQQIFYICSDNVSANKLGFSDREFLNIKEKMMNYINGEKILN